MLGKRTWGLKEAVEPLAALLDKVPQDVPRTRAVGLGTFCGLAFVLERHPGGSTDVYLEGKWVRREALGRDSQGPRAVHNALRRVVDSYGERLSWVRRELENNRTLIRDYRERIGAAFAGEEYLASLTKAWDELKVSLSDRGDRSGRNSAELAVDIKTLIAVNKKVVEEIRKRRHNRAMAKIGDSTISSLPEQQSVPE